MRVPDMFLKVVCFLCVGEDPAQMRFGGTAFLVSVPVDEPLAVVYLVTAKHCTTKGPLHVRVNLQNGGSKYLRIGNNWIHPSDPASDVAVMRWAPQDHHSWAHIPLSMVATEQTLSEHAIGVGDDVAISGLFSKRTGHKENLPVVRLGSIAAVPSEPISDSITGLSYHAYLIEIRSIAGLSGSPVLVMLNPGRVVDKNIPYPRQGFLIGLIRGHWDIDQQDWAMDQPEQGPINVGMAVVTPSTEILDAINQPSEIAWRQSLAEAKLREPKPTQSR